MKPSSLALAALVGLALAGQAQAQPTPLPAFEVQEVDKTLKVGYGVRLADLNADGKLDIVVADARRLIWFDNPDWKLHTIFEVPEGEQDNVCLDVHDIDGDGKLDIALGGEWQPGNTFGGGVLRWLRQGETPDAPWAVTKIAEDIPTLHRVHFGDVDADGKAELVVGPLRGRGSTPQKNFEDKGVELTAWPIPKDPAKDKWEPVLLTDQLHTMHNFLPLATPEGPSVLTASYEGVSVVTRNAAGQWTVSPLGQGNQDNPGGSKGASEIKIGKAAGGKELIATIEPFHGNEVAVYAAPDAKDAGGLWTRTVLDNSLAEGHAVALADLDGDGADEVIAGWRGGNAPGINIYKASGAEEGGGEGAARTPRPGVIWEKNEFEKGGVACEDLVCGDLNADGKIDIVAVGRATGNVRIYWNKGLPEEKK